MADFASPTKGPSMTKPSDEYGKTLSAGYVQIRKGSLLSSVMAGAWKRVNKKATNRTKKK